MKIKRRESGVTQRTAEKTPRKIHFLCKARGISKTAPYFNNNSAETLEAVLDHYVAFFACLLAKAVVLVSHFPDILFQVDAWTT